MDPQALKAFRELQVPQVLKECLVLLGLLVLPELMD
jgi:hypothetical protein